MKKRLFSIIMALLVIMVATCRAASYTLPEKMYNQLVIGSGLKGSFTITADGEKFNTPFLKAVSDAEISVRGIASGKDFHYYLFQADENDQPSALNELYRKDGICYFRSDMVQGKILAFPTLGQILDALFPARGENGSSSSFVSRIMTLPDEDKKEKWDPVMTRYQNELEMWLADFTVKADTVRLENGFSALDFTYEIPMSRVNEKIISLYGEFTRDSEVSALLDTVMTPEEKSIYLNPDLLFFYQQALNSLVINEPVRMNKRVSAMGDLLRFRLELPLDERTTGYRSVYIETIDQLTVYTLNGNDEILMLAMPEATTFSQAAYEQSVWYARIYTGSADTGKKGSIAVRIDIRKTNETHEEDEKTHETDHYSVVIQQDTSYLPEGTDLSGLAASEPVTAELDLHYSSKYAQNSATTLEIAAEVRESGSTLQISGKLKTAAPWLFMPFEVIDPIETGTDTGKVLVPYFEDWISNAASMIHHSPSESTVETPQQTAEAPESENDQKNEEGVPSDPEEQDPEAETQPLGN